MTLTMVILALALLMASASSSPLLRPTLAQTNLIGRIDGEFRLPNNSVPISYVISLVPHIVPGNFTFDGKAKILLRVLEPSRTITLHTNKLTYNEDLTELVSEAGVSQNITGHTYSLDEHFMHIGTTNELAIGNYTLSFSYVGILDNDMYGFYRSSYINASGDTVWLATTQFEATSARRAFPCYDEPALKATFDISIKHEPEFHALSNMPIKQTFTDDMDGKIWTIFDTTPIMSTFLVAFLVSDFTAIKNSDESYSVWSRPNAIDEIQYVFELGPIVLEELENFTNVTYSLPKMDQISVPDFALEGMENWGLVNYRARTFHFNENTSTLATKQKIATLMSHELSHQWFGNLVTPLWWKYYWLKEGFATYFEYRIADAIEDNWRLMDQFVVGTQQNIAMILDSMPISQPMNQDVASPSEIQANPPYISYSKASAVIRMMSHFLTEGVFKAGLTKYLNAMAYRAADPDDLFEALQEAATEAAILPEHVYVEDVMDTWVEQMGYPVVTVTRNYTTATTEVTQERFLSFGDADSNDNHDYKWWVPINWVSQSNPDFSSTVAQDWIRSQDESIIISGLNINDWVIFNKQQTGYYRVNYDDTNWGKLARYLNSEDYVNIHVLNRASLIDDAFRLAMAGRLSYPIVLDLTLYLQREVDHIPWYPAFLGLNSLHRTLANGDEYESIRAYLSFLLSNVFNSVGIEENDSDDHLTRLNRGKVISHACEYGLAKCRSSAEEKLVAWLENSTTSPLSATLQSSVICAGLRSANATTWNKALNRYRTSTLTAERDELLAGLGCSEDEAIINNWLNAIIDSATGLSTSVSLSAFTHVYKGSLYNVDRAFDFIVNNVDRMTSYFGSNTSIQTFILEIASVMTTPAQLDRLNAFIADYSTILGADTTNAVANVESNIAWNTANGPEISAWILATSTDWEVTTTAPDIETTPLGTTTSETTPSETPSSEIEDPITEASESSARTAYLSFFSVILGFVCLIKLN